MIDTLMQMYLNTTFLAMVAFTQICTGKLTFSEDPISPVIFFAMTAIISVPSLFFAGKTNTDLSTAEVFGKYGAWYRILRHYSKSPRNALLAPTIFLIKRFVYCIVAVWVFNGFAWGQISSLIVVQLSTACYYADANPYENKWLGYMHMMNEVTVLSSLYWLYIFAGLIPDPEIAYEAAITLTNVLYSILLLNFMGALFLTYQQFQL